MSLRQRDYILRMIEQLAEALGAMAGLRKAGKHDEAAQLWQSTADGLFGPMLGMLEGLDAASAAMLLANREKLLGYAALSAERGALSRARGAVRQAAREHRRALELYLEAASTGPALDARSREVIHVLRVEVPAPTLDPRYQAALEKLQSLG